MLKNSLHRGNINEETNRDVLDETKIKCSFRQLDNLYQLVQ